MRTKSWSILLLALLLGRAEARVEAPPNVVVIFLDDAGYSDFHPFGNPSYPTPNVQRLASEGARFNRFFVPQAVCSASRAALLTGCYPERTKMFGALMPGEKGLDRGFATMAGVLKSSGYKTAIYGKWHLGEEPDTRPAARGFDESSGLLLSNDMWDQNVKDPAKWADYHLTYWENDKVTCERVTPDFQKTLTARATADAVGFIERNKESPFFLYLPFSMPHVPLYCSDAFKGKSGAGLYGDVIMELDDAIGRILSALKSNGLEENTIVIMTSDNGPWTLWGNHAGSTPFREAKNTSFNGGTQSALIVKYPGKIKPGTSSDAMFCSVDLLPTLCQLTGSALPENEIDGRNVWPLISGEAGATNPHSYYPVTVGQKFEALMSGDGRWKLHLPHDYRRVAKPGADGVPGEFETQEVGLSLFDLHNDPGETTNVIGANAAVGDQLKQLAEEHRRKFYE
jgi:arylsulfatase A-like enzyme